MVILSLFSIAYMCNEGFVAVNYDENYVYVLSYKKLREKTLNNIEKISKLKVHMTYILYSEFCYCIQKYNTEIMGKNQSHDLTRSIMRHIINSAIENKSSDVHFEGESSMCYVRFRMDGVLNCFFKFPLPVYDKILSIVKLESSMDISKKLVPQDGNMNFNFKNQVYNMRTSTLPSMYREKLVIRILNPEKQINLQDLGFKNHAEVLKNLAFKSNGIFLVSGPTSSGKSTTLKAIINLMNKKEKNIITIEDPIEYKISGITQVSLNEKANMGFKEALKSVLRQDPDVIMIGEIRDEETAKIALRAAITGHLVLSTIHTYDATSVITRLLDMNIEKYILLDALSYIVSQRLVRKICPHCREEYVNQYGDCYEFVEEGTKLYRGKGCEKCNFTGYMGRSIIYEILIMDDKCKQYISENKDLSGFRKFCIDNGFITLQSMCKQYIKSGITSLEEVYKVVL